MFNYRQTLSQWSPEASFSESVFCRLDTLLLEQIQGETEAKENMSNMMKLKVRFYFRELLRKCASTAMSSKLIHQQKDHFSKIVVDAVLSLDAPLLPLDMIGEVTFLPYDRL